MTSKQWNKFMKMKNGNQQFRVVHINKGKSYISNYIASLEDFLATTCPSICSINEANIEENSNLHTKGIADYKCEISKPPASNKFARACLFVKDNVNYKRRPELEPSGLACVIIEVKFNKFSFIVIGYYRQWAVPGEPYSDSPASQILRFNKFTKLINKIGGNNKILVASDTNLDMHDFSITAAPHLVEMRDSFHDLLVTQNFAIHNEEPTFFRKGSRPSFIDHLWSNMAHHISNVVTDHHPLSYDHKFIALTVGTSGDSPLPRFIQIRDWKGMSQINLKIAVESNENLHKIFHSEDPDFIAETIQSELNNIVEMLAPSKVVPVKKNWTPYVNSELRAKIKFNNTLLTRAINLGDPGDWSAFRANRLRINKNLELARAEYITKNLHKGSTQWKTLKMETGKNSFVTPKSIIYNGNVERRPRYIAEIANNHYINKIYNIRKDLEKEKTDPMTFTKALIPRNPEELRIPMVSISQVRHLIGKLKSSGSTGYDNLSSKTLKKLADLISPHIMHMINTILRTSTFPQCFKVTKIIPILKPGKPADQIDSYRPINCLPSLEKLTEGWILQAVNEWMERCKGFSQL